MAKLLTYKKEVRFYSIVTSWEDIWRMKRSWERRFVEQTLETMA